MVKLPEKHLWPEYVAYQVRKFIQKDREWIVENANPHHTMDIMGFIHSVPHADTISVKAPETFRLAVEEGCRQASFDLFGEPDRIIPSVVPGVTFDIDMCFEGRSFKPKYLGDALLQESQFKTIKGNDEIYWYENGVYRKNGREQIMMRCVDYLCEEFTKHRANEVIAYISACSYIDPEEVNNAWLNLENGLLNPETGEFREHTPDIFSITRIPIEYDPDAKSPFFEEQLSNKVGPETVRDVQEMFGYCFMPGQKFEKAFLLHGRPRTMKSTTLWALEQLIGDENITSMSLQKLTSDQFAPAYLFGMAANICADITSTELKNDGMFMAITGGDLINAGKKYQHSIDFRPSSKLIFSCNNIPPTSNKDMAFYRRWVMLRFNRPHNKSEIDPDMKEKMRSELPGILNWALKGLRRIQKQNGLSYNVEDHEIKDRWERYSDTIQSFVYNEIDTERDDRSLTKRETYKAYVEYCRKIQAVPENVIKFGKWFIAHTGCATGKKGEIPAYKGVSFKGQTGEQHSVKEYSDGP